MKSFTTIAVIALVAVCAMAVAPQRSRPMAAKGPHVDPAGTYEHLATAIIAIRETENSLVHTMLAGYAASARADLMAAADAPTPDRKRMLEAAATQITNLANEGDKRIQAVRQRLLKAGHHHNTDEATNEDYMFIDSVEKSALLAVAGEVARMHRATPEQIRAATKQFTTLSNDALKPG